jgi:transcriptional regulator with XRE-family HTH domain
MTIRRGRQKRNRTAAGLSQAELARRAGIDSATLNRIEKPKVTPDEATVRKIDRAIEGATRTSARAAVKARRRLSAKK